MLQPALNDSEYDLIYKVSMNLWTKAGGVASGVVKPDYGHDDKLTLLKKAVSSSALL